MLCTLLNDNSSSNSNKDNSHSDMEKGSHLSKSHDAQDTEVYMHYLIYSSQQTSEVVIICSYLQFADEKPFGSER